MPGSIEQAADLLARSKTVVALTGAGISVDSGIPPFRGKGGLWEKIDPMTVAHVNALEKNPELVWKILIRDLKTVLDKARPNPGHTGLFDLEQMGILKTIITQNIDGLHQMAGNKDVIEFHGTFTRQRCMDCDKRMEASQLDLSTIPPRCDCGGILRPDAVFFGEMIPSEALVRSQQAAATCDAMLVVGTSATVQPAATIPFLARDNDAAVIEINPEPTPLTSRISTVSLMGGSGSIMPKLVKEVRKRLTPP